MPWWLTARAEAFAMVDMIAFTGEDVSAAFSTCIFASDAQGQGEGDDGGWGVVRADIDDSVAQHCLSVGPRPGYTVTKLSGESNGVGRPDLAFRHGIPFSRLPPSLFVKRSMSQRAAAAAAAAGAARRRKEGRD